MLGYEKHEQQCVSLYGTTAVRSAVHVLLLLGLGLKVSQV